MTENIQSIHDMYNAKLKQYQDYLVEKRVHERKLAATLDDLKSAIATVTEKLASRSDDFSVKLLALLSKYNTEDALQTASSVAAFKSELQEMSKVLEAQIREALA